MTKREALIKTIGMWDWLAEDSSREKSDWPGLGGAHILSSCFCCEYTRRQQTKPLTALDCQTLCPLVGYAWEATDGQNYHCCRPGTPYEIWRRGNYRPESARQIAAAARKALAELVD
jgi:hypothetical protein